MLQIYKIDLKIQKIEMNLQSNQCITTTLGTQNGGLCWHVVVGQRSLYVISSVVPRYSQGTLSNKMGKKSADNWVKFCKKISLDFYSIPQVGNRCFRALERNCQLSKSRIAIEGHMYRRQFHKCLRERFPYVFQSWLLAPKINFVRKMRS